MARYRAATLPSWSWYAGGQSTKARKCWTATMPQCAASARQLQGMTRAPRAASSAASSALASGAPAAPRPVVLQARPRWRRQEHMSRSHESFAGAKRGAHRPGSPRPGSARRRSRAGRGGPAARRWPRAAPLPWACRPGSGARRQPPVLQAGSPTAGSAHALLPPAGPPAPVAPPPPRTSERPSFLLYLTTRVCSLRRRLCWARPAGCSRHAAALSACVRGGGVRRVGKGWRAGASSTKAGSPPRRCACRTSASASSPASPLAAAILCSALRRYLRA